MVSQHDGVSWYVIFIQEAKSIQPLIEPIYQEPFPETCAKIDKRLEALRENSITLSLVTVRAIMVAYIKHDVPELFTKTFPDGSQFRCSESFVRKYLHTLGWSERCSTRAAQKLPDNFEQILSDAFLRQACIIRDHGIPAPLRVNTDQMQTHYQMGGKRNWNKTGEKQVSTMGMDEKHAFTLVPSISASRELLPMQTIFHGQTSASCPSKQARRYTKAEEQGFKFEPSRSHTYWSMQATMQLLVNGIIPPYFDQKKKELGLPSSQCSIWMIDCWSVHKSEEFRGWMKISHPTIIISFVPGNCTGVWQPLNVGTQRVLKQSMKRLAHKDIVIETMTHLDSGAPSSTFKLDTSLGTLRDRSVAWILNAYHDINKEELIMKVCRLTFYCEHIQTESIICFRRLSYVMWANSTFRTPA